MSDLELIALLDKARKLQEDAEALRREAKRLWHLVDEAQATDSLERLQVKAQLAGVLAESWSTWALSAQIRTAVLSELHSRREKRALLKILPIQ